ncbi:MAG: NFACT family protein, partial [Thermoplasmata archaeon]|nr:NFACT family protein [Thermoplasmata archaeon]
GGSRARSREKGMAGGPTTKDRFTALDTLAVVREVRALDRTHVDKAFDLAEAGWSLALRTRGEGKRELLLVPGRYAALLPFGSERSEELSPFARELRRLLTGAAVDRVAEPAGERFLEIAFTRGDTSSELLLSLEMFGTGNVTVALGGKIAAVAFTRRWAHRLVRVGAEYARPPTRTDPWELAEPSIEEILTRSRTDLTSTLAARFGLGGPLAEELIARMQVDGAEPSTAAPAERARSLRTVLAELRGELGDRPAGFLYLRDGAFVDATPYPSRRWVGVAGVTEERRPTFSEASREYFRGIVIIPPTAREAEVSSEKKEIERMLERQNQAIVELTAEIEGLQAGAETILAHYTEAQVALEQARAAGTSERHVKVELGGRPIVLEITASPRESAQKLFEEAKRRSGKLAGARAALADTAARTVAPAPPRTPSATGPSGVLLPVKKPFWFEKFRWFISTEGAIVIAGRDAPSNDLIVRRNLKDGDFYLHADLHGAASVIVKRPTGTIVVGEPTLREAAQWAVSFSKAWRAGFASGTAFWVNPDQVSKAAASGEFVPRGAWVIHGTKNFVRDVPLEIALGIVTYEGGQRWTAAPESAVRSRGEVRAVLRPGEERDRATIERSLAESLGVSRSLLQSLLPAGGISVLRT